MIESFGIFAINYTSSQTKFTKPRLSSISSVIFYSAAGYVLLRLYRFAAFNISLVSTLLDVSTVFMFNA